MLVRIYALKESGVLTTSKLKKDVFWTLCWIFESWFELIALLWACFELKRLLNDLDVKILAFVLEKCARTAICTFVRAKLV